jgi:glycosyltransferase involved in cell wall biosynthesis|tara:strand:- start:22 stop:1149 length:1128 start_codon:yes stop_codon:yes gene_type:complete
LSKRKVIIIGPAFPFRGGIANFNNALAQAYHDRGDNITLYSFTLQYPSFLFPGTTQYETGEAPKNLKIKTLINSVNPFNWIQVARKINKENPDYIIIRYWLPFMAPCLGSIARLLNKKIKILAITDNVIPHEKRMGDTIFTKYFIKSCDAFLTLSASVLDDLSKFTKTTVKKYIPHPIYDVFGEKIAKEKAIKNLGLNPEDKHLLFFGFVRKYKGLDLMLQAMADNRIKEMEIKLIIAGEFYDDKKEYTDMINDLGIADNIIMKSDFIPADKVKSYFCASDMITQTYRTATQSGVTQIAYSFDRPMLVTDVGGLAEIVPNNKVGYVTSQNPTSIADAIVDFYTNNKEAEFTINTGAEKKRFSWGSFVNGIEDLML